MSAKIVEPEGAEESAEDLPGLLAFFVVCVLFTLLLDGVGSARLAGPVRDPHPTRQADAPSNQTVPNFQGQNESNRSDTP